MWLCIYLIASQTAGTLSQHGSRAAARNLNPPSSNLQSAYKSRPRSQFAYTEMWPQLGDSMVYIAPWRWRIELFGAGSRRFWLLTPNQWLENSMHHVLESFPQDPPGVHRMQLDGPYRQQWQRPKNKPNRVLGSKKRISRAKNRSTK